MIEAEAQQVLLARIDERTRMLGQQIDVLSDRIDKKYVTIDQFDAYKKEMKPIKQGFVALISITGFTVLVAILNNVITK